MHHLFLVSAGRFKPTLAEGRWPSNRALGDTVCTGQRCLKDGELAYVELWALYVETFLVEVGQYLVISRLDFVVITAEYRWTV